MSQAMIPSTSAPSTPDQKPSMCSPKPISPLIHDDEKKQEAR